MYITDLANKLHFASCNPLYPTHLLRPANLSTSNASKLKAEMLGRMVKMLGNSTDSSPAVSQFTDTFWPHGGMK